MEWKPNLPYLDHILSNFKVSLLPSFWRVDFFYNMYLTRLRRLDFENNIKDPE